MQKLILLIIFLLSNIIYSQVKYYNTFTLISNGQGTDITDSVKLSLDEQYLNLYSKTFKISGAKKTGKNEMYNDSKKGDMIVSQYFTKYYNIALIRYLENPNEAYLKIIDISDNKNYLIHLHNK